MHPPSEKRNNIKQKFYMLCQSRYLTFFSKLDAPSDFPNSVVDIISVVRAKTCDVIFDSFFFTPTSYLSEKPVSLYLQSILIFLPLLITSTTIHNHRSSCSHPHCLPASSTEQPETSLCCKLNFVLFISTNLHPIISS